MGHKGSETGVETDTVPFIGRQSRLNNGGDQMGEGYKENIKYSRFSGFSPNIRI